MTALRVAAARVVARIVPPGHDAVVTDALEAFAEAIIAEAVQRPIYIPPLRSAPPREVRFGDLWVVRYVRRDISRERVVVYAGAATPAGSPWRYVDTGDTENDGFVRANFVRVFGDGDPLQVLWGRT